MEARLAVIARVRLVALGLGDHFAPPENLGAPVNSPGDEIEAFVTPDESALIFSARGRSDSLGAYDLYVARCAGGVWQAPARR